MYMATNHMLYHAEAKNKRARNAKQEKRSFIKTAATGLIITFALVTAKIVFNLPVFI